jgi:hypothetical protein
LTIHPFLLTEAKPLPSTNIRSSAWLFVDLLTLLTIFRGVRASVNKGGGSAQYIPIERQNPTVTKRRFRAIIMDQTNEKEVDRYVSRRDRGPAAGK